MWRKAWFPRLASRAAAFDDAAWPAASGLTDDFCGFKGNMLAAGYGHELRAADVMFARLCYRGQHHPEWERGYCAVIITPRGPIT